jgi:putative DNA-invertase from lambdoid prophage Rac
MGNWYGYTRVSTDKQVDGNSLEHQHQVISALCQLKAASVTEIFSDPAVSGADPLVERPAGKQLLSRLQPGDAVVVSKLDRGFRSVADALTVAEQLRELGVDLYVVDFGADPVGKGTTGKFIFTILAAVAEMERGLIRERMAAGREVKKARGGALGGDAPFGYTKQGTGKEATLVQDPVQQAAIQTATQARADGLGYHAIAGRIEERHGLKISHMGVKRLLERLTA